MSNLRDDGINWREVSLEEVFELAIADEEYACDYYRRAAGMAGTPHTRRLLLELSDMEKGHADVLRKELEELKIERDQEAGMAD